MEAEKQIAEFVGRLKQTAGANLECVVLFGSAASGEFHPDFSDINILCVLRELSATTLAALAPTINDWTKQKFPAPLLFSRIELEHSTDVFAIEMFDICQRHRVLHGEDIFATLHVPMNLHRVQLEHNLRTKLLTLRQTYIQAVGDTNRVRRLCSIPFQILARSSGTRSSPWEISQRPAKRTTSRNWRNESNLIPKFFYNYCKHVRQRKTR
jgi:predicted nucleotidyltransferase